MDNKLKILSIFAVVFAVTLLSASTIYAQQNTIVNPTPTPTPNPQPNNQNASIYGCTDGLVIFTSSKDTLNASKGINLACIVKPFNYKPFNSQSIVTEQKVKSICDFIKVYDPKFKCPKILS
jgi:hypothetical protein